MWQLSIRSTTLFFVTVGSLTLLTGAQGALTPTPIDVIAYRLSLDLDPEMSALKAAAEIRLVVTEGGADGIRFDLVGLEVDSVRVDGVTSSFTRDATSLNVEVKRRAAGDTLVVEIHYGGSPEEGLIFRSSVQGRASIFADNWPNRARYWFPSVDHPSDKATVEFHVRAPQDMDVVANGLLVSELIEEDGKKLTVWATKVPIPVYTMVIGVTEMSVREIGGLGCDGGRDTCMRISQWVYPEDEERALRLFGRAPEMVAFYDSLIGPFPYEKLALVQSSTRYGGMENSSAIFFSESLSSGRSGEGLVAHEIAHQWFGDAVTEREWPHLWLSEGFATYFAAVFFEFREGDYAGAERMANAEQRYLSSGRTPWSPVIDVEPSDLSSLLNANNYQKGAWVLHMLRGIVGDEAFFEAVRRYYAEHMNQTALTEDFQRIVEEELGEELAWFFEQWLRTPGVPIVEARPFWNEATSTLVLRVRQGQPWPPFRFPLKFAATGEGYRLEETFWVKSRDDRFEWSLPGEPSKILIDPENALLGPTAMAE
jgi:aminopeptidase N